MANEILLLDDHSGGVKTDARRLNMIFFFPCSAYSMSRQTVVLTPFDALPALAKPGVTTSQRSALDAGMMVWEAQTLTTDATGSALTSAITTYYAQRYSAFTQYQARRLQYFGLSINS